MRMQNIYFQDLMKQIQLRRGLGRQAGGAVPAQKVLIRTHSKDFKDRFGSDLLDWYRQRLSEEVIASEKRIADDIVQLRRGVPQFTV